MRKKRKNLALRTKRKKKELILSKAIELFTEKGYRSTAVSDITTSAQIGKGTFYLYFKNKLEVFRACMGMVADKALQEPFPTSNCNEQDFELRMYGRALALFQASRELSGIFTALRRGLEMQDLKNYLLAKNYTCKMIRPIISDLEEAVEANIIRNIDVYSIAHILLVLAETFHFRRRFDTKIELEESLKSYLDIIKYGIIQPRADAQLINQKKS